MTSDPQFEKQVCRIYDRDGFFQGQVFGIPFRKEELKKRYAKMSYGRFKYYAQTKTELDENKSRLLDHSAQDLYMFFYHSEYSFDGIGKKLINPKSEYPSSFGQTAEDFFNEHATPKKTGEDTWSISLIPPYMENLQRYADDDNSRKFDPKTDIPETFPGQKLVWSTDPKQPDLLGYKLEGAFCGYLMNGYGRVESSEWDLYNEILSQAVLSNHFKLPANFEATENQSKLTPPGSKSEYYSNQANQPNQDSKTIGKDRKPATGTERR